MVALDADGYPLWRCSGTFLSPTLFLTAGHCTESPAASATIWFDADKEHSQFDPAMILRSYHASRREEFTLDKDEAFLGPASAPIELVVFSDAFCPHCQTWWQQRDSPIKRYGDQLRIVFKHFPFEKACNTHVAMTLHPRSCEAACAMEAARRQGQFWAYHEALSDPRYRDRADSLLAAAAAIGLDLDQFQSDCAESSTADRVARDVALGDRLGIDGTPAFILDGRRISDSRPESLQLQLDHVIATANHPSRKRAAVAHDR